MSGGLSPTAGSRAAAAARPAPAAVPRVPVEPPAPAGPADGGVDGELLRRARAGDRAAFGVLVERHHRTLAAVLRQRFGPRAPVEDLLQEVFARTLARLDGFEGRSSFLTWATAIALHLATDWRRREDRRRRLAPRAEEAPDDVPARAPGAGPGAAAERREEWERVRVALDTIPAAHRVAVTLRVVESHPYEEVGRRLGVSTALARTWVSRGLRALRDRLDGEGGVDHA